VQQIGHAGVLKEPAGLSKLARTRRGSGSQPIGCDSEAACGRKRRSAARRPRQPVAVARGIQCRIDFGAYAAQLQVDGLGRARQLIGPISPENVLKLDNIRTELQLSTNNTCLLDNVSGLPAQQLALSGDIAHAPELRRLGMFHGGTSTNHRGASAQLVTFSDVLGGYIRRHGRNGT